jgi:glycosyltransferase involved in cell wall biosynthesis
MSDHLSILVPVYNESQGLARSYRELRDFFEKRDFAFELILVDDASTDDSPSIIADLVARDPRVKSLRHPTNQGPCSGLKTGPTLATGDWLLLLPADLSIPLDDITRLWERRGDADIVLGYLNRPQQRPVRRRVQSAVYTWLINRLFAMELRQVNFVALYRTEIFRRIRLQTSGVALHAEILVRARDAGFSLQQVGLEFRPRREGVESGGRPKSILKTLVEISKLGLEIKLRHGAARNR